MPDQGLGLIRFGLITFWAGWISLVFAMNFLEGLQLLGVLPPGWRFASQNYATIEKATEKYKVQGWLDRLLFSGVILWQAAGAVLFWLALAKGITARQPATGWTNLAFGVVMALFAAFVWSDEIFKNYKGERDHLLILTAMAASLLLVWAG